MSDQPKWIPELYYHLYNRGHNHSNIFFNQKDYSLFLEKISEYLLDFVEILSYVLIPNHFHLLIKIKQENILKEKFFCHTNKIKIPDSNKIIAQQLSNMFNSYVKHINLREKRTGSLFEKRIRRKIIKDDNNLKCVIGYIHTNPIKHQIVKNIDKYKWSSYNTIISTKNTKINRNETIGIFESLDDFIEFHQNYSKYVDEMKIINFIID